MSQIDINQTVETSEDDFPEADIIIEDGNEAAREVARDTLEEVRSAMGLSYK